MEPPDATPDLVGRTSARLLADGVGRLDRLEALRLLAVLDASVDATGRVRRPLDDLAAEFELTPMSVLRSLDHLERAGAILRDGGTVLLLDRDEGIGGMRLADFLDDVTASFDDELEPISEDRPPWLARAGAALVAGVAVLGLLVLAPSGHGGQPVATATTSSTEYGPSTTTGSPWGTSMTIERDGSETTLAPRTASAPSSSSSTIISPSETPLAAARQCPKGEPIATVIGNIIRISNGGTAGVVVTSLDIGGVLTPTAIVVPAGQSADYPLPAPPVSASVRSWYLSDPGTALFCAP